MLRALMPRCLMVRALMPRGLFQPSPGRGSPSWALSAATLLFSGRKVSANSTVKYVS